jgi:chromosome segregation ATPase
LEEIIFKQSTSSITTTSPGSGNGTSLAAVAVDDAIAENNTFYLNKINQLTQELTKAQKYSTTLLDSLNESKKQIKSQKGEIYSLEAQVSELQQRVSEVQNLEELRQNFEEYSQNITQQIDQDRLKIERETAYLTSERSKHLTEKTQLDEKVN